MDSSGTFGKYVWEHLWTLIYQHEAQFMARRSQHNVAANPPGVSGCAGSDFTGLGADIHVDDIG